MPGGFANYPPAAIQAAVRREIPEFPIERFNSIAAMYFTEWQHFAQPPAEVRKTMQQIGQSAADLWVALGALSEEATDALFDVSGAVGIPSPEAFSDTLRLLMEAARHAENRVGSPPRGRGQGPLAVLVSRLAKTMEGIGLEVDKRPRGNLVTLAKSVLEGYGHSTDNVQKAVQRHLDKMGSAKT